jgi:hypothetical protein
MAAIINRFFDNDRQLKYIYLIAVAASIFSFFFCPRLDFYDIHTYMRAKEMLLEQGVLDAFRTPVYPIFLAITGNTATAHIVQTLIFLLSIRYIYKTLKLLSSSRKLIVAFSLVYVIHPTLQFYNFQILAESLAISFTSIYLYFVISYLKTARAGYCWAFHFIMLLLVFLKPVFIFLSVISLGILAYNIIHKKQPFKSISVFIISLAVQASVIFCYMSAIHSRYGVYGLSNVTDINFFWIMDMKGIIDKTTFPDNRMDAVHNNIDRCGFMINEYGWPETHRIVWKNLRMNYREYLFGESINGERAYRSAWSFTNISGKNAWKVVANSLGLTFYQLFWFFGLYIFLIARYWIKTKKIPVISLILLGIPLINCFVIYINCIDDYSRFFVPSLTAMLYLFMQVLSWGLAAVSRKPFQWE